MFIYCGWYIKEIIEMYMTDVKKQELNYLLLKGKKGEVDWYDFVQSAEAFTEAFDAELSKPYNEDRKVLDKFWKIIDTQNIQKLLGVDVVTEKNDFLLVIKKTNFDFVYFSVVHQKSLLHMGCWLCMPHDEDKNPHIMCCLLYATRVQKLSEWQVEVEDEENNVKPWAKTLNLDESLEFS
jgi:hypothetical protein